MIKVLFVCTGNICRSPTAEGVFAHKVTSLGLHDRISWDSAGTRSGHIGCAPDPRAAATALKRGYNLSALRARQVKYDDFETFDLLLCMDRGHLEILLEASPTQFHDKIKMFDAQDVKDPYYGGEKGFEDVLDQIEAACDRWISHCKSM